MICIDMDGTLLNSKHKISEASMQAIRRAHDQNIHIVVSTGRTYSDAEAYSNLLNVKSPIIASNGAIIRSTESDDFIYRNSIGGSTCIKLLDIFQKYNVRPNIYTTEKVYFGRLADKLFFEFLKLKGMMNGSLKLKFARSWKHTHDIVSAEQGNIMKCEIAEKDLEKLKKVREELENTKEIEVVSSSKHVIEITNKGVSKGKAIGILASYYNIDREEIVAIGDSENDLTMMEYAGVGVAMGNAADIVKQKAKYITDSNDNDGVAKFINQFVC